jgi:hypothetical protein
MLYPSERVVKESEVYAWLQDAVTDGEIEVDEPVHRIPLHTAIAMLNDNGRVTLTGPIQVDDAVE